MKQKQQAIIEQTKEITTFIETNPSKNKIIVVGTGAFGSAIANMLISFNEFVILYGIDKKEINDINLNHRNSKYYNTKLNEKLYAISDAKSAFKDAFIIVLAVPSSVMDVVLKKSIIPNLTKPAFFVNVSKGFDFLHVRLLCDLIKETVPKKYNLGTLKLTGPSFAVNLVKNEYTAFTLAGDNLSVLEKIEPYFNASFIKLNLVDNLEAIELLSVIKNPFALLMGMLSGLGYGENTKAYFFTLMLKEMCHLIESFGGDSTLVFTPAGVGDLFLTSNSKKSRNFFVGYKIGRSDKVTKKVLSLFSTVEGLRTIEILLSIVKRKKINLKLLELLYNVNYKEQKPSKEIEDFLKNDDKNKNLRREI